MRSIIIYLIIFLCFACDKVSSPPIAVINVYPPRGDSTTLFELNASESSDDSSLKPTLEYRWDFNGDGVWDTGFGSNATTLRYYPIPSTYQIAVQVRDQDGLTTIATDSVVVFGRNTDVSSFTDPRDGNSYRIVRINGRWWMAECLRYGRAIDPWNQQQLDNQIVECYLLWSYSNHKEYCAYTWHEAMNHNPNDAQGICPDGWHLPTKDDWESLSEEIPNFFALKYYGRNGLSGLDLHDGQIFFISRNVHILDGYSYQAAYWSSGHYLNDKGSLIVNYGSFSVYYSAFGLSEAEDLNLGFSDDPQILNTVRCIKDQ